MCNAAQPISWKTHIWVSVWDIAGNIKQNNLGEVVGFVLVSNWCRQYHPLMWATNNKDAYCVI